MGKHYLVDDSLFYAHNPYVQKNPYLHTEVEDAPTRFRASFTIT